MNGFLLVNKPVGMTSHDVVYYLKRKFNIKKIGHTGTLDPFASGLLILCIGKATKLADLFQNKDKTYEGTIIFNHHYDTYDHTGTILESKNIVIDQDVLKEQIHQMIGTYDQLPPMYAAIKVNGKKLYELARQGITIKRDTRKVSIYDFKMLSPLKDNAFDFSIEVSKGTYIRSIAVDLAEKLDTFGALARLNRTSIGQYSLKNAHDLEKIEIHDLITLETYFSNYPKLNLNPYMIKLVKNGIYLDERQTTMDCDFVVYDEEDQMIAFYQRTQPNTYKPALIL
ncbi:tRNA pseudouridine(55) synthase TruB [Mariniplasma anaerobium]|uniref:tRNA pseudouridine synthase B n=1 Tax=Mariniplasma anaerobium TaxID=2735436 RepID=A0A7U9XVM3_9MOLU|nr:tRNA pseudouridine(55) synthase TruB [Mariniplasma anaerobium]BCR35988.1 tRNA pseudouridine synthase B [Mariniplasma anaerobium]